MVYHTIEVESSARRTPTQEELSHSIYTGRTAQPNQMNNDDLKIYNSNALSDSITTSHLGTGVFGEVVRDSFCLP